MSNCWFVLATLSREQVVVDFISMQNHIYKHDWALLYDPSYQDWLTWGYPNFSHARAKMLPWLVLETSSIVWLFDIMVTLPSCTMQPSRVHVTLVQDTNRATTSHAVTLMIFRLHLAWDHLSWISVDYEWALFLTVKLTSLMQTIPPQNYMFGVQII